MTNGTHPSSWQWSVLAAAPAAMLLAFQATWAWPFFSDDSFISLRYAERLLGGHGLTWTDGERVEGYSNLLWVLLTAGLGALGLELVSAARLLGAVATMLALWLLARAQQPHDGRSVVLAAIPPLLVASTQVVLVWTLGGLEGPLLLLLMAWGFGGVVQACYQQPDPGNWSPRQLLRLGVPFALACWTRPDGPLWALTAGVGIAALARRSRAITAAFWLGLPALLAVASQLIFRIAYYGDVVPNTAHVKAEFDAASFGPGFDYVRDALLVVPGLAAMTLLGAVLLTARARPRAFVLVLLLPVLAWFVYLVAIGGDHFPGRRLMHGALAPMALLAGLGLRALGRTTTVTIAGLVLALGAATADVWHSRSDPRSREARAEVWEWHAKVLGETLARAFAEQRPRIAVDAAGALPFYCRLPALDMLGLCDRTIATTPFPAWLDTVRPGTPKPPGHLRGNGAYVIEQRPDLMLFQHAPGLPLPVFVSACEFEADPRFLDHYRCVMLDLGTPEILPGRKEPHVAPLWVRVDGRAGVVRTDERVVVPAYLFGSFRLQGPVIDRWQPPTGDPVVDGELAANAARITQFLVERTVTAVPTASGSLALALAPTARPRFTLTVQAGQWRTLCEPTGCGATAHIVAPTPGATGETFNLAEDGEVTIELRAQAAAPAHPVRVVLERIN